MSANRIGPVNGRNLERGEGVAMPSSGTAPRIPNVNANIERGIANAASRSALLNNIRRGVNLQHMYPEPSAPPMNSEALKPYLMTIKGLRNQLRNAPNNAEKQKLRNAIRNAIIETRGVLRISRGNLTGNFSNEDKRLLQGMRANLTFRNLRGAYGTGGKSRKASRRRMTRRRR